MTLATQGVSFNIPHIDQIQGCYRVWDKKGKLKVTYYLEDNCWVVDFGSEELYKFKHESQARACAIAGN